MTILNTIPAGRAIMSIGVSIAMLAALPGGVARANHVGAGIAGGIIGGIIGACASGGCNRRERVRREYREERPRYREERPRYRKERPRYKKRRAVKKKVRKIHKKKRVVIARKPVITADHLIQQDLKVLGFYFGPINGNLSSGASREAAKSYQGTFGLDQSGRLMAETREILKQQAALQTARIYLEDATLVSGRKLNRKIQTALAVLDHYRGKIDGSIGPQSRRSIKAFQERNGFSPTGALEGVQTTRLITVARSRINQRENEFRTELAAIADPSGVSVAGIEPEDASGLAARAEQETVEPRVANASTLETTEPVIRKSIEISASVSNFGTASPGFVEIGLPNEDLAKFKRPNAVAIIIGNKNYLNKDIPEVTYAFRDADAMKKVFVEKLGVKLDNIVDLRDATKSQIEQAFGNAETIEETTLWSYVEPDSDVYVYYSGHGMPTKVKGEAYILPVDADPNSPNISGYPLRRLYANLNKVQAKSITVFVEACFSGGSSGGMLLKSASPIFAQTNLKDLDTGKITVFTAARGTEIASWDNEAKLGLFTNVTVNGLYGAADKGDFGNGDGVVTAGELQSYLSKNVRRKAKRTFKRLQNPVLDGNTEQKLSYIN